MFPSQPRRTRSAPKLRTSSDRPTRAWGSEKQKLSKSYTKEKVVDDSSEPWYIASTDDSTGQSKPCQKKSIKLSFRKKLFFASKKESKSTSDLVEEKKKSIQPPTLLLKPPEQVVDWYKVVDSPLLLSKETPRSKIELSASSPNLHEITIESDLPDPSSSAIVPSNVALAAYPPSPYELTCSPQSFTSYLEEVKSPRIAGRSRSFGYHNAISSPLALTSGTKCEVSEECDTDKLRRPPHLSFGRKSGRHSLSESFPPSPTFASNNHSVLNTSPSNLSFGRTHCNSIGGRCEQHTVTQYPGHPKTTIAQRVPVKGSPQASPTSYYVPRRIKTSHSFNAQTSYSVNALDYIEGNYEPKSRSMVCECAPYVPREEPSVFKFPVPFQRGGSERSPLRYKAYRASYLNAIITAPLRRPSHLTSTPTHTYPTHTNVTPTFSYIGRSSTPPSSRSPASQIGSSQSPASQIGSLQSVRSDASESFSLFDTQSEICSGGRPRSYGNSGRVFQNCRGQRAYRSMVLTKRRILFSM